MALFSKILIANRGEIACRIIDTARRLGIATVAVYSDADRDARHVALADEAIHIGPSPSAESYLRGNAILDAARATGAEAIHPGYGFLSENPDFVDAVTAAGRVFIGPSATAIRAMGLKDAAKALMEAAGVPVVPGYHGADQDGAHLAAEAARIGYPVLIKARAGGGGKGMRLVDEPADFAGALASAQREAAASFGDDHVLIEKFITNPRHIEVQVFGDSHGSVVHLYERDCSLQRRHQKVIEEAPAPGMTAVMRQAMTAAAVRAAREISYTGAGTVEFIVDGSGALDPEKFWFMEMNTRLQVEHPVTEAITGTDLVEWQIRVAAGEPLPLAQADIPLQGHAFEARIYAEDPAHDFLPAAGPLHHLRLGAGRIDTGVRTGDQVTPFYDPMIAKLTTHGPDRETALARLVVGLGESHIAGIVSNLRFLKALAGHPDFAAGRVDTGLIEREMDALLAPAQVPDALRLLAGIAALDLDPAMPRFGWRHWGDASHRLRVWINGVEETLRLNLDAGGQAVHLQEPAVTLTDLRRDGPIITGNLDGRRLRAEAIATGDGISIQFDGATHLVRRHDPLAGGDDGIGTPGIATAPMTGVVRVLDVALGQEVQEGDRLLVLEAMKMEHALTAGQAGKVAEIACAAGDAVEGGAILVRIDDGE